MTQAAPTSLAGLRRRGDLLVERQVHQGLPVWMVKDPLARNYYRLGEQEYTVWQCLDGRATLESIVQKYRRRFPEDDVSSEDIGEFVKGLVAGGLVTSASSWQGHRLARAAAKKRQAARLSGVGSILSIRLPLLDPDRLLSALRPLVGWMTSLPAVIASFILIASALMLVVTNFSEFTARLPSLQSFFTPQTLVCLFVVTITTKVLHEFGHAFVCQRQGSEVHEMGILVMFFMPVLYCDVSDSWMLPSRWRRAMIGAAGMWVELVLASLATWIWWFSNPGLVNTLALSTMTVCSVGTLLFNANPLLRYDGYYILSDLTETPNLQQEARSNLAQLLRWLCLGIPRDADTPIRPWFLVYSIAGFCYRWVLVIGILWMLEKMFEPYRLEVLGRALSILVITGMVLAPTWAMLRYLMKRDVRQQMNFLRFALSLALLGGLGWWVLSWPSSHRVFCEAVVESRDARRVYVQTAGSMTESLVAEGADVREGTPLARLENLQIERELVDLRQQIAEQEALVAQLEQDRFRDPTAATRLPSTLQAVQDLKKLLEQRRTEATKLTLTAPASGRILPAPEVPRQESKHGPLPNWSGQPTAAENHGAWLTSGTLYCLIGQPGCVEVLLLIDQADIEYVRAGQAVDLLVRGFVGRPWRGEIAEVARLDMQTVPPQLSNRAGGPVPTRTDETGRERPLSPCYVARVAIDDPSGGLRPGLRATAKIHVGTQTWGTWLTRRVAQTFNFDW